MAKDERWSWFIIWPDVVDDQLIGEESELEGAPAAFLHRLRDLIPTWTSLGLTADDTGAACEDGKVWVSVHVGDAHGQTSLGNLRVDVTDTEWIAGWATSDVLTHSDFADSLPFERTGGPMTDIEQGIDEATGWLVAQLRRPVVRRQWRRNGRVVARSWRFEDTGRVIVVSGDPKIRSNLDTADDVVQVRP